MAYTREATVSLALSQVGYYECQGHSHVGQNHTKYGSWFGFDGQPWCAMYLSWVLSSAGNTSGYRFASTAASVSWARQRGRLVPLDQAQPGDVLVRLYTSTTGHTGMATARPSGGRQRTAEGNTSGSDDRNGGNVMHRDRAADWWHYCIRLDFPAPAPPTTSPGVSVFNPPLSLQPIVSSAKDPQNGGSWLLGRDGSIYAFDGARYLGGPNGKTYFAGRTAARLEITADGRYAVIATSGERYGPGF